MTILLYEDTWDGFLTGVFEVFDRKSEDICLRRNTTPATFFETVTAETDEEKAARAEKGMRKLGAEVPELLYMAWLSEEDGLEERITGFMRHGFRIKRNPSDDLLHPDVKRVRKAAGDVSWEAHRMLQFVRFTRTGDGLYVGDIAPKYNVLTLIGEHFHGRFNDQPLLLRDTLRRLALVSRQEGWVITDLGDGPLPPLPEDDIFEDLWRGYFKAVSNPARKNLKLQRQFVPLRYRGLMTEFKGGL